MFSLLWKPLQESHQSLWESRSSVTNERLWISSSLAFDDPFPGKQASKQTRRDLNLPLFPRFSRDRDSCKGSYRMHESMGIPF